MTAPRIGNHGPLDRLSPLDLSNLRVEARGHPMHVAALMILDGQPDPEVLRAIVERRLRQRPRLRQLLYRPPPGLGPPVWVDDQDFDVRQRWASRIRGGRDPAAAATGGVRPGSSAVRADILAAG